MRAAWAARHPDHLVHGCMFHMSQVKVRVNWFGADMYCASSDDCWFKIIFHINCTGRELIRCNMLPQLVDSKSFSTQCTNNLYQKCISIFRTCGSKSRRRDLLGSTIARGRKARYLKVIETPSVCSILLEQSLSFCELRVCLDAPCLANDPSTKNERVPSTAGVWNRPSWISVSPSFWPWRLGIHQVSKLIQASVQCYHYVGTIISRDHLAMNAMAGSGMCSTG